jgi:two-component system phosphate regulon sensor histidine kinase PhoR
MHRKSRLTFFIPLIIPIIAALAWSQFNWFQELNGRESRRIETSMMESAGELSTRLVEEISLLPSLFKADSYDPATVDKLLGERYRFWMEYAIEPGMLKSIRLLDTRKNETFEWNGDRLAPVPDLAVGDSQGISQDDRSNILILSPLLHNGDNRLMMEYAFHRDVIVARLIPLLARKYLDESELYRYRIVDGETDAVLFTSDSLDTPMPDKPDVEIRLMENFILASHGNLNTLSDGIGIRDYPLRWKSEAQYTPKRRAYRFPAPPEERSIAFSRLDLGNILLQIYNRDASLALLSRRTSIVNAAISLGTFALLAFLFDLLVRTGKHERDLAQRQREFIATITHELKTPLAVISSAAENLTDGIVSDRAKVTQYGSAIKKEAARLSRTIDHVLLYSRTHSSTQPKQGIIRVSDLVEAALKLTDAERAAIGMTVELSVPEPDLTIRGDRGALESVLINLVQNAVRHAAEGKYLRIEAMREIARKSGKKNAESLIIKVADRGPGIPPREQKTVFMPFARGKRAIDEQIPGNGIGLSLVMRVVEMHGGTVSLESRPGCGTTVTVRIPRMRGVDHAWQDSDD